MKKTLKLVAIFISVLVVVIVGGVSIFLLMQNNQTYYIYDLRIVKPLNDVQGYVYTDSEKTYTSIKNSSVSLNSSSKNMFQIGVYAHTSTNTTRVGIASSDESVAKVIYLDGKCYINYVGEGSATITASIASVTDSFTLTVYDNIATNFEVYDDSHFGEFARDKENVNKIMAYSDGEEYSFSYAVSTTNIENGDTSQNDFVNNQNLRITNVDSDIIESIRIDAENYKLIVKCKDNLSRTVCTFVNVQAFVTDKNGEIKASSPSQRVEISVVAYEPEFLQFEVSQTPDFNSGRVFVDTKYVDPSEDMNSYLDYEKAEHNLSLRNECPVYNVFFTEKISKIYLRLRKVYTNGDVVYLYPSESEGSFNISDSNGKLALSANGEYYILSLTKEDLASPYKLSVSLLDFNLSHDFEFKFAEQTAEFVSEFYSFKDGAIKYTYWDNRAHFDSEIFDENGNIIGFVGIDISSVLETE